MPETPANLPTLEERIESLLRLTASEIRPCKACGQRLYFIRLHSGKKAPYTMDGINHFVTCPGADRFRQGKAGA